jgi:hypothetical protein
LLDFYWKLSWVFVPNLLGLKLVSVQDPICSYVYKLSLPCFFTVLS